MKVQAPAAKVVGMRRLDHGKATLTRSLFLQLCNPVATIRAIRYSDNPSSTGGRAAIANMPLMVRSNEWCETRIVYLMLAKPSTLKGSCLRGVGSHFLFRQGFIEA